MKKLVVVFFVFIIAGTKGIAQLRGELTEKQASRGYRVSSPKKSNAFDPAKLTLGGGFGLQFGSYTLVNVAPQVGYDFSNKFNAGVGLSYTYAKDSYRDYGVKWKDQSHYAGFNIYARVYPIANIVLMIQPDIHRVWNTLENTSTGEKHTTEKMVPAFLVGGGLRLGSLIAMIQYDVVQDDYSPYGRNIFYSVGYSWNF